MSSPTNTSLNARAAANSRWSRLSAAQRSEATAAARAAIDARLLAEIDPDGQLGDDERDRRLANARSAYYAGLARRRRSKALVDQTLADEIIVAAAAIIEDRP